MNINRARPDKWKEDIVRSVDFYNAWFMEFAPKAYREARIHTAARVERALHVTNALRDISTSVLTKHPEVLSILRMSTCPPIARDRLVGLAGVSKRLVECMESEVPKIPQSINGERLIAELNKINNIITAMADPDIFIWLKNKKQPTEIELSRAATIIADRLCGAISDPIIRNAQEKRQLASIEVWLTKRGYKKVEKSIKFDKMERGTFSFRTNVPVTDPTGEEKINIPVDVVIMPFLGEEDELPLLIEAKSAGDFTNVNKRRKEEAQKMAQLKRTYSDRIRYGLFLCGYFDSGYLGYEAAEGIDWIWEHRIDDLALYNL